MKDVMGDLETLGKRAGCVILSIGAVMFDRELGLGSDFYVVINRQSCLDAGLHEDPSTVAWWQEQSETARRVLTEAENSRVTLSQGLQMFSEWLRVTQLDDHGNSAGLEQLRVWGNGADFDNAILQSAYAAVGQEAPWNFWNNRCHRTLKNLYPEVTAHQFRGVKHNALDDARAQAIHAIDIMQRMEELRNPPSWYMRLCRRWLLV